MLARVDIECIHVAKMFSLVAQRDALPRGEVSHVRAVAIAGPRSGVSRVVVDPVVLDSFDPPLVFRGLCGAVGEVNEYRLRVLVHCGQRLPFFVHVLIAAGENGARVELRRQIGGAQAESKTSGICGVMVLASGYEQSAVVGIEAQRHPIEQLSVELVRLDQPHRCYDRVVGNGNLDHVDRARHRFSIRTPRLRIAFVIDAGHKIGVGVIHDRRTGRDTDLRECWGRCRGGAGSCFCFRGGTRRQVN